MIKHAYFFTQTLPSAVSLVNVLRQMSNTHKKALAGLFRQGQYRFHRNILLIIGQASVYFFFRA